MSTLELEELLYMVEKPARYIGKEINAIKKNSGAVVVRFGFAFPDVYEVGMSHLGMHILYNLLNEEEDIYCERIFSPWVDMEDLLRKRNIPLFTLESHSPIKELDFLGFTLQYELSYTNILNILNLGQIPLRSSERGEEDPIVIAGGPCAYNPEPLADMIDLFVLGEGEEVILELLKKYKSFKKEKKSKKEFIRSVTDIEGVYVPSLYETEYNKDQTIKQFTVLDESAPLKINKRIIKDLNTSYYPSKVIVPFLARSFSETRYFFEIPIFI